MDLFDDIKYLKTGNSTQRKVYRVLTELNIFNLLKEFNPILVGSIPIEIDTDKSDLDIICYWKKKENFTKILQDNLSNLPDFSIEEKVKRERFTIIARFKISNFEVEIFGQNRPTKEQEAYRHMIIEHHILHKFGAHFKTKIVELKQQGVKTEVAFGDLLGLKGDPYMELLNYKIDDINKRGVSV